jgi:hypothetical protein
VTSILAYDNMALITTVNVELVLLSMTLDNICYVISGTMLTVTIIPTYYDTVFITTVKVELVLFSMTLGNISCVMSGTILKVTIIITIRLSLQP